MQLDLASLRSVRAFATAFLRQEPHLHLLINNAGERQDPRPPSLAPPDHPPWVAIASFAGVSAGGTTEDGFSLPFQVNHLGHFLLTQLLLERLQSCAPSRVVIVASRAHCAGHLRPDTLGRPPSGLFSAFQDYCDSKLANVLHARELATRLQGTQVTCYAVHPGRDPALQPRAGDGGTGVGSVSAFAWGVLCAGCPFMQGGLCMVQALHRAAFARCAFCTVQPLHREFLHVEHPLLQSVLCVASPFARSTAQPLHGVPLRDALFASALFARNIPLRGVSLCKSIPSHSVPVHIVSLCTKRPFARRTLAQSILFLHGVPCTEPCAAITRPDGARAAPPGKAAAKLPMQRPPWRGRFRFSQQNRLLRGPFPAGSRDAPRPLPLAPGFVNTELFRHTPLWLKPLFLPLAWLFFLDAAEGAQTSLHCAMQEGLERFSGRYFADCRLQEPWPPARDDRLARALWEASERLVGLGGPGENPLSAPAAVVQ